MSTLDALSRRFRCWSCLTLLVCGLLTASLVWAAEPPAMVLEPTATWKTRRVVLLPLERYVERSEGIFRGADTGPGMEGAEGIWTRRLETTLERGLALKVVEAQAVARILTEREAYREVLSLARERFSLGVEAYKTLRLSDALTHLLRARQLFDDGLLDFVHPRQRADIAMYQGIALSEQGDDASALQAFRDMWLFDPARSFKQGYYPANIEEVLQAAQREIFSQRSLGRLRFGFDRLKALDDHLDADIWLIPTLTGTEEAVVLEIIGLDARQGETLFEFQIPLDEDGMAQDALDREVSAWLSCSTELTEPSFRRPLLSRKQLYVDVGYAHMTFLKHDRTTDFFQMPGVGLTLTYEPLRFLQAHFSMSYFAAIPDRNGDLLDTFLMTRLAAGVGIVGGSDTFRGFFSAGFDIALSLTDIRMTKDTRCKHWDSAPQCDPSKILLDRATGAWVGLVLSSGFKWVFAEPWYVGVKVDLATYLGDSTLSRDLNFPLGGSASVGVRF